jgi:hypothetical protein
VLDGFGDPYGVPAGRERNALSKRNGGLADVLLVRTGIEIFALCALHVRKLARMIDRDEAAEAPARRRLPTWVVDIQA